MDGHFRAFSFVDRITHVEAGVCARGVYRIPAGIETFPSSLVAESVGQLAAWSAMAAVNFTHRPVAGLAGAVELLGAVRPGQTLELAAELEAADTETVAYTGTAHVGGAPVLRLHDCVGPMVPLEDFDDPEAVRGRFEVLCGRGASPGGFGGLPGLSFARAGLEPGQALAAVLQVPAEAPFFADHFPRRHVFPGTLLLHHNLQLASELASEALPGGAAAWTLGRVSDVKLRTFIPPGEQLRVEVRLVDRDEASATVAIETRNAKRLVGSAEARFVRTRA